MGNEDKKISEGLQSLARNRLALNLKQQRFYITVCPSIKLLSITERAGLRCMACGAYHGFLEVDREDIKDIAEGHVNPVIKAFYERQISLGE